MTHEAIEGGHEKKERDGDRRLEKVAQFLAKRPAGRPRGQRDQDPQGQAADAEKENLQVGPAAQQQRGAGEEPAGCAMLPHGEIHAQHDPRQPHHRQAARAAAEQVDPAEGQGDGRQRTEEHRSGVGRVPSQQPQRAQRGQPEGQQAGDVPRERAAAQGRQQGIRQGEGRVVGAGPIAVLVAARVELVHVVEPRDAPGHHVAGQLEVIQQLKMIAGQHGPDMALLDVLRRHRDAVPEEPRERPREGSPHGQGNRQTAQH